MHSGAGALFGFFAWLGGQVVMSQDINLHGYVLGIGRNHLRPL